jgi:type II secretory pathway component GspD/PulD (secretin)
MIPFVGEAFKTTVKEYQKSELIIFLRPVIVNNPTVDSDLDFYKPFLESRRQSSGSVSGEGSR